MTVYKKEWALSSKVINLNSDQCKFSKSGLFSPMGPPIKSFLRLDAILLRSVILGANKNDDNLQNAVNWFKLYLFKVTVIGYRI